MGAGGILPLIVFTLIVCTLPLIVCTLPLIVCTLGTGVGESSSNINPRRESHINVNVAPPHEFGTDTPEIRFNIHSIF